MNKMEMNKLIETHKKALSTPPNGWLRRVGLVLGLGLLGVSGGVSAQYQFELSPGYTSMKVTGFVADPIDHERITSSHPSGVADSGVHVLVEGLRASGEEYWTYYDVNLSSCNGQVPNNGILNRGYFTNILNSTPRVFPPSPGTGPIPSDAISARITSYAVFCTDEINKTVGYGFVALDETFIINPPTPQRVCTLDNQTLNFNFNSTSLNVNGLSQAKSLVVKCTSGDARDYKISLTGTRVDNGRLSFGNGASAQISLNGSTLTANGSAIPLGSLSAGSLPVRATLVGTATGSGTTTTNGVLVLESQ